MAEKELDAIREDGSPCVVIEVAPDVRHSPLRGSRAALPGNPEYVLGTGEELSPNRDGSFTVVQTDEIIRLS